MLDRAVLPDEQSTTSSLAWAGYERTHLCIEVGLDAKEKEIATAIRANPSLGDGVGTRGRSRVVELQSGTMTEENEKRALHVSQEPLSRHLLKIAGRHPKGEGGGVRSDAEKGPTFITASKMGAGAEN